MNATLDAIEARIYNIIFEITTIAPEDIEPEHDLQLDLGMDSVASMELVSMLAEEFDIDVELEEAMKVSDVKGVVEMTRRHLTHVH